MEKRLISFDFTESLDRPGLVDGAGIIAGHGSELAEHWLASSVVKAPGQQSLVSALIDAWHTHVAGNDWNSRYDIPGHPDREFVVYGGTTTQGEEPYEGYGNLSVLFVMADEIPEFGRRLGHLGHGIVLAE